MAHLNLPPFLLNTTALHLAISRALMSIPDFSDQNRFGEESGYQNLEEAVASQLRATRLQKTYKQISDIFQYNNSILQAVQVTHSQLASWLLSKAADYSECREEREKRIHSVKKMGGTGTERRGPREPFWEAFILDFCWRCLQVRKTRVSPSSATRAFDPVILV